MGAASRRKGASGEREVVRLLREELGDDAIRRNLDQTRDGGHDILGVGPFCLEVKRCENEQFTRWIKQAREQAGPNIPVVAHRKNGEPWRFLVELDARDFVYLVREYL